MTQTITTSRQGFSPVFFLRDVAAILQMSESRVKNWTMGRPMSIVPRRRATGSGSRNLYCVRDLHRFGLAQQLSTAGFEPYAIQLVLAELGPDFTSAEFALITTGHAGQMTWQKSKQNVKVIPREQHDQQGGWRVIEDAISNSLGCYVLNLRQITQTVDHLADLFMRKNPAIYGVAAEPHSAHRPSPQANRPARLEGLFPKGRKIRDD